LNKINKYYFITIFKLEIHFYIELQTLRKSGDVAGFSEIYVDAKDETTGEVFTLRIL
jgi:hypothetical protein